MADDEDDFISGLLFNTICVASVSLLLTRDGIQCGLNNTSIIEKKYGVFYMLLPELATNDARRWLHYIWWDIAT